MACRKVLLNSSPAQHRRWLTRASGITTAREPAISVQPNSHCRVRESLAVACQRRLARAEARWATAARAHYNGTSAFTFSRSSYDSAQLWPCVANGVVFDDPGISIGLLG